MLAADDVDVDVVRVARQLVHHRPKHDLAPARAWRLAHDDFRDIAGAGIGENLRADVLTAQSHALRSQLFGEAQRMYDPLTVCLGQSQLHVIDVDCQPLGPQPRCHTSCRPHQPYWRAGWG